MLLSIQSHAYEYIAVKKTQKKKEGAHVVSPDTLMQKSKIKVQLMKGIMLARYANTTHPVHYISGLPSLPFFSCPTLRSRVPIFEIVALEPVRLVFEVRR